MRHPSTLLLHRLRYGELEAPQEREVRQHLASCTRCSARLGAQHANREAFVLEPVPQALKSPPPRRRWWTLTVPVLAMAAALLIVPRVWNAEVVGPEPEVTREKGAGVLLEAWLETTDGPKLLAEGGLVTEGDTIQLKYDAEGLHFVSFGGIDGQGNTEVYGSFSTEDGIVNAPFALTLDRTPGKQRFYALFTQDRPQDEDVERAIQTQTPPRGGILRSLTLRKR